MVHSDAEHVSVAPRSGGCSGTYLTVPPGISMFEMYLLPSAVFSRKSRSLDHVLVKVRLKDNNLVSRLNEGHTGTEYAFIGSCGNDDISLRVEFVVQKGLVGSGYRFSEAEPSLI